MNNTTMIIALIFVVSSFISCEGPYECYARPGISDIREYEGIIRIEWEGFEPVEKLSRYKLGEGASKWNWEWSRKVTGVYYLDDDCLIPGTTYGYTVTDIAGGRSPVKAIEYRGPINEKEEAGG